MRVRAKKVVYYNDRRYREGQEFDLVERTGADGTKVSIESQFSEKSMEKADEAPRKREEKGKAARKVEAKKGEPTGDQDLI